MHRAGRWTALFTAGPSGTWTRRSGWESWPAPCRNGSTPPWPVTFQFLKALHTANVDRNKGFDEFDRLEVGLPDPEAKDQASYSIFRICDQLDSVYGYGKENYYYYEGMRLYQQGKKKQALNFLRPVADSGLINKRVAIACHLTGKVLSRDNRERERVEGYYRKGIQIGQDICDNSIQA